MKTPNIELPELSQSESPAYANLNDGFRALDAIVQLNVESRSIATPPVVEQGTRYIVASSPTGDWVGHARHIAYKTASGWDFRTPRKGWKARVFDEDSGDFQKYVAFDGLNWVDYSPLIALNGLFDVTYPTPPNDGDSLIWNDGLGKWVPSTPSLALDDLINVDTVTVPPENGYVLTYDSVNDVWYPAVGGAGGVSSSVSIGTITTISGLSLNLTTEGDFDWFSWGSTQNYTGRERKKRNGMGMFKDLWWSADTGSGTSALTSWGFGSSPTFSALDAFDTAGSGNVGTGVFRSCAAGESLFIAVPVTSTPRIMRVYMSNAYPIDVYCRFSDGTNTSQTGIGSPGSANIYIPITFSGQNGLTMQVEIRKITSTGNLGFSLATIQTI